MSASVRWTLLMLAWLGAACGDGGDGDVPIPCNIADEPCRRAIFLLTAQVREQEGARMPPSRIISRKQYTEETLRDLSMRTDTVEDRQYERALQLLRFLPAGTGAGQAMADSDIGGVAAYYTSTSKAVTIIDDAAEEPENGSLTLSHEYVHALQDNRETLEAIYRDAASTDQYMAANALVEGEATALSDAVLQRAYGRDYNLSAAQGWFSTILANLMGSIIASPAPFTEAQAVLPYPVGGAPLAVAYDRGGASGIAAYYRQRPDTLAEWIDPSRTNLPIAVRCSFPDAPAGYRRFAFDSFGVAGLIALEVTMGSRELSFPNSKVWSGDRIAIFGAIDQSTNVAVAWRIGFTSTDAARTLIERLQARGTTLSLVQQVNEVVITTASEPGVLEGWAVRNDCGSEKSLTEPRAFWPELPHWFARRLVQLRRGAEGGSRTRTP